jgi:hypothetical protein
MSTRTAECGCGRVRVTVQDEPFHVCACHCDFCQKRTGSAFGVQAYFTQDQCVDIVGETKVYNGFEVDGIASFGGPTQTPDYHFCTTCGSTVYWTMPGGAGETLIGIAVGNFVEREFPSPMQEYQTRMRHHWVTANPSAEQFETFPGSSTTSQ